MPVLRTKSSQSRDSSPYMMIKRPSQTIIEKLANSRIPVRYHCAGLHMPKHIFQQTLSRIEVLAIRHLDCSITYCDQPPAQLDLLKREVLLDEDLSHLMQYEDGWAADVIIRLIFQRIRPLRDLQPLLKLQETQGPRQRESSICSRSDSPPVVKGNQDTKEGHVTPCFSSSTTTPASSHLHHLSTYLDSVTPSLHRLYAVITQAGLSTDDHLDHFFRMSSVSRERFLIDALAQNSTLFEKVAVMEVLEEMRKSNL